MANVVQDEQSVVLRVTDREWRLIMKSLAHFVGIKVSAKVEDKMAASVLNRSLLEQRVKMLRGHLETAEQALHKSDAEWVVPPVDAPEAGLINGAGFGEGV